MDKLNIEELIETKSELFERMHGMNLKQFIYADYTINQLRENYDQYGQVNTYQFDIKNKHIPDYKIDNSEFKATLKLLENDFWIEQHYNSPMLYKLHIEGWKRLVGFSTYMEYCTKQAEEETARNKATLKQIKREKWNKIIHPFTKNIWGVVSGVIIGVMVMVLAKYFGLIK